MVSMVFAQSQLLQKEVYLFEQLEIAERKPMTHLKAVCLLRPTRQNIDHLCDELRSPKYGEYHLCMFVCLFCFLFLFFFFSF